MKNFRSAGEIIKDTITELEKTYSSDPEPDISCGIGFNNGETILICGDRLSGKIPLILSFISKLSISGETPCGLISAAMNESDLMRRLISSQCSIETERLKHGELKPYDFRLLASGSEKIYDSSLYISAESLMTLNKMVKTAGEMKYQQNIKILFIDRLELLTLGQCFKDFDNQMEYLSLTLKKLAAELMIPIVATYQSNNNESFYSFFDQIYSLKRTKSESDERLIGITGKGMEASRIWKMRINNSTSKAHVIDTIDEAALWEQWFEQES